MFKKSLDHLRSVNETYFQHMRFAVCIGTRLIGAGIAVIIHALFPAFFQYTASQTIFRLHDDMTSRLKRTKSGEAHD